MISTYQSSFRSLHSTATALLEATNSWAYNIDQGNVNAVVFLNLKKAFDTVDPRGGGGTWVNVYWVCAAGLSEPLPHYSLFFGQL